MPTIWSSMVSFMIKREHISSPLIRMLKVLYTSLSKSITNNKLHFLPSLLIIWYHRFGTYQSKLINDQISNKKMPFKTNLNRT